MIDYSHLIEPVARHFWGEPNEQQSKPGELRFGSHGSKSVDLDKSTFYDHEALRGGGVLDLVKYATEAKTRKDAHAWLVQQGFLSEGDTPAPRPAAPTARTAPAKTQRPKIVATYDYCDEADNLEFQVLRKEPKTFSQRRPDGDGWKYSVKDARILPYRLPELLAAPEELVFIVEGEKDADRLASMGLVSTCNAGGAGKWKKEHSRFLKGRRVVILPDNDGTGDLHAKAVKKSLRGIAKQVRIVELPGLELKGDVSDWLDAGGTLEALQELLEEAGSAHAGAPDAAPAGADDSAEDAEGRKPSQTDLLVKFVRERFELLHDKNGDTYARDLHTGEVRRMAARAFRDRVAAGFYEKFEFATREQAWREALSTLQALARFEGEAQEVFIRVAGSNGRYLVDLCQPGNARCVEIDAGGWRILHRAPVVFVRSESMQPLPDPVQGSLDALWSIANVPQEGRLLVLAWLIDAMRPDTPFPGLELHGEQGSGKSTTAEALRRLVDPSACNLRGAPKTVEDIFVAAGQNHIVSYENVSHLPGPMQDALAILSTGGGFAKRQLYTDAEEHVISVRRPWMVNGISVSVTQQDLVDRVVGIECPVIETRQSSSLQWREFEQALPGMLGALYDLAAGALCELPGIQLAREDRPRLVEFVTLGMAMAQAMGEQPAAFLAQFKAARLESVSRTLDASPVALAVQDFIESTPIGITAPVKEILVRLEQFKPQGADAWPRSPKGLGDALRRAAPALRQIGIDCTCSGKGSGGVVRWTVKKRSERHDPQPVNLGLGTSGTSEREVSLNAEVF